MAQSNFLNGLKKLLFQDEPGTRPAGPTPPLAEPTAPASYAAPAAMPDDAWGSTPTPAATAAPTGGSGSVGAAQMQAKATQLLESINQPGVDFLEVWNAVLEQGGPSAQHVRSAFTTLRFADKSLTKEKVVSTGRFYIQKLQDAIDADVQRKAARMTQLEQEKEQRRRALSDEVGSLEQQLSALQESLRQKQEEQARLDEHYTAPIAEIRQTITVGQATVAEMVGRMNDMVSLAEREL